MAFVRLGIAQAFLVRLGVAGRSGAGPAEYRELNGISIVHDSILVGFDVALGRLITFDPSGKYVESLPLGKAYSGISGALRSDREGVFLSSRYLLDQNGRPLALPPDRIQWKRLVNRQVVDSVVEPPYVVPSEPVLRLSSGTNFSVESHVWPLPGTGVVSGIDSRLAFTVHPFRGRARTIDISWTPEPLLADERREWEALADFHGGPARTTYRIPRTKPAFKDMFVDADSRVWLQVYTRAETRELPPRENPSPAPRLHWLEDPTYEVFEPSGRYLGRVVLPLRSRLMAARGDRIWVKTTGAEGEHLITAYQVVPSRAR